MSVANSKDSANSSISRRSPLEDPLINPSDCDDVVSAQTSLPLFTNAMVTSTGQILVPLSNSDVTWSNGIPMVAYNAPINIVSKTNTYEIKPDKKVHVLKRQVFGQRGSENQLQPMKGLDNFRLVNGSSEQQLLFSPRTSVQSTFTQSSIGSQQQQIPNVQNLVPFQQQQQQDFAKAMPNNGAPGGAGDFLGRSPLTERMSSKKDPRIIQRDLDLSRGKLKATSRTSALLAGFAMVALVELEYPESSTPRWMLLIFAIITTMLVSVHLLALMMSTCILPHLEAPASDYTGALKDSPHERLRWYIEASWLFSTCLGLLLFLLEIAVVFWIKFVAVHYTAAAWVTTGILIPVFILFILFTCTFYRKLTGYHTDRWKKQIDELQQLWGDLETAGGGLHAGPGGQKTSMSQIKVI